eukprot:COSAG02_NODE_10217_length_1993_cov_1.789197_1_plen_52_part_00
MRPAHANALEQASSQPSRVCLLLTAVDVLAPMGTVTVNVTANVETLVHVDL